MNILVFLQHSEGSVSKATLTTITAALELKQSMNASEVTGICLGKDAKTAATVCAPYGLSSILVGEDPVYTPYQASIFATACIEAMNQSGSSIFVATATSTGKDFVPRMAAVLEAGMASDIVAVNSDGTVRRPMYAGDVLADVEIATEKKLITVRASAFSVPATQGSAAQVKDFSMSQLPQSLCEVVSSEFSKAERPELGDASIVVSGGRALQSSENFEKLLFPLADALNAAVGASRAAVDSGYAPNDWQVGQTGKIVAPDLYIAVGISGAIQHLAGMKDSKVIVAINKDAEAPIYEIADYGLVADLFQALPELTEKIKAHRGK